MELLTPTGRVMLAKRLAIIFMLKKKYPFSVIEKTLKVTLSTVNRLYKETKTRSLESITRRFSRDKAKKEFWSSLDLGMPPIGKRRWKFLDKRYDSVR